MKKLQQEEDEKRNLFQQNQRKRMNRKRKRANTTIQDKNALNHKRIKRSSSQSSLPKRRIKQIPVVQKRVAASIFDNSAFDLNNFPDENSDSSS